MEEVLPLPIPVDNTEPIANWTRDCLVKRFGYFRLVFCLITRDWTVTFHCVYRIMKESRNVRKIQSLTKLKLLNALVHTQHMDETDHSLVLTECKRPSVTLR